MRFAALLFVAALLPAAACEVAFPFDRSLIPPDAGSDFGDSGFFAADAGVPAEDAPPLGDGATDASAQAQDGDAATDAALDGLADGAAVADSDARTDAVADATAGLEASADGSDGSD